MKAKAKNQSKMSAVRRLFLDDPGSIQGEGVNGFEAVYTWKGGDIARIDDWIVAPVAWLQNSGALPWKLDWIEHDEQNQCWYIRRIHEDKSDG